MIRVLSVAQRRALLNVQRPFSSSTKEGQGQANFSSAKPKSSNMKYFVGAAALVGGALVYDSCKNNAGLIRSTKFWLAAFPIFCHYKFVEWKVAGAPDEEQDKAYNELHDRYTKDVYDLTVDLRGFYIKTAQLLSTRDEFCPPQYLSWCKDLQDSMPSPFAPGQVQSIVERELGKPIAEIFSHFDEKPLGAASIGQVHRATLHNGQQVVVKVMFPGVEEMFRADFKVIWDFCKLAQPQHLPALREIEKQFMTEFDYRLEAKNLQLVHDNIMPVFGDRVVVPKPLQELCTEQVLVMEYLDGEKMIDGIKRQFTRIAEKQGKTLADLEREQRQAVKEYKEKTGKDLQGPSKLRMKAYQSMLRAKDMVVNSGKVINNYTLAPLRLTKPLEYSHTELPINLPEILELLLHVHGWEIFQDGAFNGDPHPGNILLLKDGRLGLIDYGQVKIMTLEQRISYAKLILAMAAHDDVETVRVFTEDIGAVTKNNIPEVQARMAMFFNDRDTDDVTKGMNVHLFMEWMDQVDGLKDTPDDFVMAGRVSLLLRGMGNAFLVRQRTATAWKPFAEKLLRDNGVHYEPVPNRALPGVPLIKATA